MNNFVSVCRFLYIQTTLFITILSECISVHSSVYFPIHMLFPIHTHKHFHISHKNSLPSKVVFLCKHIYRIYPERISFALPNPSLGEFNQQFIRTCNLLRSAGIYITENVEQLYFLRKQGAYVPQYYEHSRAVYQYSNTISDRINKIVLKQIYSFQVAPIYIAENMYLPNGSANLNSSSCHLIHEESDRVSNSICDCINICTN